MELKTEVKSLRNFLENLIGMLFGGSLVIAYIIGALFVIFYLLFSITLLYDWITILDVGRGVLGLVCFLIANMVGFLIMGVLGSNIENRTLKIVGLIFGAGFFGVYIWVIISYFFVWLSNMLPWQGYIAEFMFIIVNIIVSFGILLSTNLLKDLLIRKE